MITTCNLFGECMYHPHDFRGIDYLNEDLERMLRVEDTRAKLITPKVLSNKLVERQ